MYRPTLKIATKAVRKLLSPSRQRKEALKSLERDQETSLMSLTRRARATRNLKRKTIKIKLRLPRTIATLREKKMKRSNLMMSLTLSKNQLSSLLETCLSHKTMTPSRTSSRSSEKSPQSPSLCQEARRRATPSLSLLLASKPRKPAML